MNIDRCIDEIAAFCRFYTNSCKETSVLCWKPGSYTYLCAPSKESIAYLSERIAGDSLSRMIASRLLRVSSYCPVLLNFNPAIISKQILVPKDSQINFVIAGYRINLFDFTNNVVYTLPTNRSHSKQVHIIVNEIIVRRSLPEGVPVPELVDANIEYPYIVEAFIPGRELRDPVTDWSAVLTALEGMCNLYTEPPTSLLNMETVLKDITDSCRQRGFQNSSRIQKTIEILHEIDLPEQIRWCRIHGDFHAGNIINHNGDISILDWEKTTIGYPIKDLFKPFVTHYRETGNTTILEQFLSMTGRGKEIGDSYGQRIGPVVYESEEFYPGLLLFYLVERILVLKDYKQCAEWKLLDYLLSKNFY